MRLSRFWLALIVPGCGFTPGSLGSAVDAADSTDVRVDTPPGQVCVGSVLYTECFEPASAPTTVYQPAAPAQPINTDDNNNCDEVVPQVSGPDLCVKRARTITITGDFHFIGERPYVLLATETITVESSSELDFSAVPDGTPPGCGATPGGQDLGAGAPAGAGGGGGGGFGSTGASGGAGQGIGGGGGGGGSGFSNNIRFGCPGAKGGNSSDGDGGAGGRPGGSLFLMAGTSITIDGNLYANGGGGRGGANKAGGGGGGSGGFIGLDAPRVTLNTGADLVANGGAGGEGGGGGAGGSPGEDATRWDVRPDGGVGNSNGSNGGDGAYMVTTAATNGGMNADGGGGGGGGFGHIRIYAKTYTPTTQMSPAALVTTIP